MNQVEFASLCGVTKQMVSKWKRDGRLVFQAGVLDPRESLANLAGVWQDEPARRQALASLAGTDFVPAPANDQETNLTFRQQADALRLERERLALARESGEVVSVKEVQKRAMEAVTRLQLGLDSRQHSLIDKIFEITGADPRLRSQLQRTVRNWKAEAMAKFAGDMARCAQIPDGEPLPSLDDLDAEDVAVG